MSCPVPCELGAHHRCRFQRLARLRSCCFARCHSTLSRVDSRAISAGRNTRCDLPKAFSCAKGMDSGRVTSRWQPPPNERARQQAAAPTIPQPLSETLTSSNTPIPPDHSHHLHTRPGNSPVSASDAIAHPDIRIARRAALHWLGTLKTQLRCIT